MIANQHYCIQPSKFIMYILTIIRLFVSENRQFSFFFLMHNKKLLSRSEMHEIYHQRNQTHNMKLKYTLHVIYNTLKYHLEKSWSHWLIPRPKSCKRCQLPLSIVLYKWLPVMRDDTIVPISNLLLQNRILLAHSVQLLTVKISK